MMKSLSRKISASAVMTLALLMFVTTGLAQVTLTLSPAVISNTYLGPITIQVGGLTNGESVTVEKWVDVNTNGIVEPGSELLLDTFTLTDGGASTIGGITNLNVPFDSNAATGAITAALNFAPPLTLENLAGHFNYRVVSPTGRFAPVTTPFSVTNAATGQLVTGVISNGAAVLSGAVVVAIQQPSGAYAGATLADAGGRYALSLNPGTYALIAANPNYYVNQSLAPLVTLTNGTVSTNNIFMTNGAVTISGSIYDAATSNKLASIGVQLQSGNLFAIAFTDSNGNYSAAVTPGFWKIKVFKERLPRRGYVVSQNTLQVDATGGNVINVNIPLYRPTALFYGSIHGSTGAPLANIEFDGGDDLFDGKGFSDANGNYVVAVLADGNDLNANPNSSVNVALANSVVNQFNNVIVSSNQTILQNYVARPIVGHITGRVVDSFGAPVTGPALYAFQFNGFNDNYQSLNSQTDADGNYSLGVANGAWQVNFSFGGNNDLEHHGLTDLFGPYTVNIPPTNATLDITVYPLGTPFLTEMRRTSPTQFVFNINGSINASYTVQVCTNLTTTNWAPLFTLQLTNNPFPITDTHATNNARFYRVLKNP